jgi:hypothetical protein
LAGPFPEIDEIEPFKPLAEAEIGDFKKQATMIKTIGDTI